MKYEYDIAICPTKELNDRFKFQNWINSFGAAGWDNYHIDGSRFYFKRLIS